MNQLKNSNIFNESSTHILHDGINPHSDIIMIISIGVLDARN
jgi:hypothetical protein